MRSILTLALAAAFTSAASAQFMDNFDDGAGGGLDDIVGFAIANGSLPDFTAEGVGQIFRVEAGGFVPEPSTGLMFLAGLAGLMRFNSRMKS